MFTESLVLQLRKLPGFTPGVLNRGGVHINVNTTVGVNYGQINPVQIGTIEFSPPISAAEAFTREVLEPLNALRRATIEQPVAMLIDALDEAVKATGESIVDLIAMANELANVKILITCRPDSTVLQALEHLNAECRPDE